MILVGVLAGAFLPSFAAALGVAFFFVHLHLVRSDYACSAFCHASEYLYPGPVLNSTTVSYGLIHPDAARMRAATTVAAPSGAAKIPSSEASSLPACSISLSVTAM